MANVQIREVGKTYAGGATVMKSVSVDIADSEFVVLVGPSGCGKSTLLRMIAGLERITSGEIRIGAKVVNDLAPKQRDIAMVFQSYALYPHMTVADNMGFSLKLSGVAKSDIERRVKAAAETLNLTSLLARLPKQLSGGQRQRVAMGRAIVRSPQVFLFDEPLSNLDAKLRVQMRAEIKALHQRLKVTTVYVTHDQIEAMTMADRIVVMNAGHIEQFGTPLELYDRPANLMVAAFIGSPSMNLLEGTIVATPAGAMFRTQAGAEFPLPDGIWPEADGRELVLGVRPEHCVPVSGEDGRGVVHGTVSVVEPTGSDTQLLVDIQGEPLTCLVRDRFDVEPGCSLRLKLDTRRMHLFDKQSGERC
jgi:multiple sugar transport system ATP-binding protein